MHEASVILNVLDIALESCRKEGYAKIDSITLMIGKASGVMPDALYFAFETAKHDTPASDASLEIIQIPVGGTCGTCGDFTVEERFVFKCPICGSADNFRVTRGRELDIVEMEVS